MERILMEDSVSQIIAQFRPIFNFNFIKCPKMDPKARPKSAVTSRTSYSIPKNYRLFDNQSFNDLKSNINRTFSSTKKSFEQIKELTSQKVDDKVKKKIQQLCIKFSILENPARKKSLDGHVDVDFIAKRYVKNKNIQRQKNDIRDELKKSIQKVSTRYEKNYPQDFFQFDYHTLRQMELKSARGNFEGQGPKRQHPYLQIYESQQNEALKQLTERNSISFGQFNEYPPPLFEADEWEKDHKKMRQIYRDISRMRSDKKKVLASKRKSSTTQNFYIT